jgi:hypothetical protein
MQIAVMTLIAIHSGLTLLSTAMSSAQPTSARQLTAKTTRIASHATDLTEWGEEGEFGSCINGPLARYGPFPVSASFLIKRGKA